MNITEEDLLDFISGRELPARVREYIAEHRKIPGNPIHNWIMDYVEAAADPYDVDWEFLALDSSDDFDESDQDSRLPVANPTIRVSRRPSFFERFKSYSALPAKWILESAAGAMSDHFYFQTAAQYQRMLCDLNCLYGAELIRAKLSLASLHQLATHAALAEEVLFSLVDRETQLVRQEYLVGMESSEIDQHQLLVSDALTQHFVDQRNLTAASQAIEQTEQQRQFQKMPASTMCNHLNARAAFQVFSNNLNNARDEFKQAQEFGIHALGKTHVRTAIATWNLSSVMTMQGLDGDALRAEALHVLQEHYPATALSEGVQRLPLVAEGIREYAIVV